MKPLLVGECNPWQDDEESAMYFALHPDPLHASGGRLCHLIMNLDERTYLRRFDRTDLCFPKWSAPKARAKAQQLVKERTTDDVIVLCGSKVASAFGVPYAPLTVYGGPHDTMRPGPRLVVIPHPSGLNRAWQDRTLIERTRVLLRQLEVLPPA